MKYLDHLVKDELTGIRGEYDLQKTKESFLGEKQKTHTIIVWVPVIPFANLQLDRL